MDGKFRIWGLDHRRSDAVCGAQRIFLRSYEEDGRLYLKK